ncbi:uncharacterized protein LOC132277206 [Cornus florida]|uniref:uncharacterized protein LOC132277206 n=1 Tax=Cornus florida TaxID=4283 RepID=UPI0028A07203|nr:uncharacterized protein LOC132277206 [Cornus florida]
MAQAARLSLRMQKELKLLLSDPPPGASFPLLSSSSSLSSIDALIKGPEGTVYAEGFFKIKIQIPERYPFQPPIVTFATPIYHPNIDNGGRICLDILNLPPKGAWQPSLNISTVLTSIGLLLSEPNPDDGLMCEASKEYKYNRQAFDQKARSMTQKYARAEENGNDSGSPSIHSHSPSMMEAKGPDDLQCEVNECVVSRKKLCGISRKLSLESSMLNTKNGSDKGENGIPIHHLIDQIKVKGQKEVSEKKIHEYNRNCEKLSGTRRKLSLEPLGASLMRGDVNKENVVLDQHSFFLNPESVSVVSSGSLPLLQVSNQYEQQSHQDRDSESINESTNTSVKKLCRVGQKPCIESLHPPQISADSDDNLQAMPQLSPSQSNSSVSHGSLPMPRDIDNELQLYQVPLYRTENGSPNIKRKKLGLAGKKLSLGSLQCQEKDNKENVAPIQRLPISQPNSLSTSSAMSSLTMSQMSVCHKGEAGSCSKNMAYRMHGIGGKLPLEPLCQLQGSCSGDNTMNMHTENQTRTPSKSLPMLYDCRRDEKQQSKQGHGEREAGATKQGGDGSPISDTVIVLDSEDSEEENNGSLKPKLLLARKRLPGKWKVKA